jgi:hypothetical protein
LQRTGWLDRLDQYGRSQLDLIIPSKNDVIPNRRAAPVRNLLSRFVRPYLLPWRSCLRFSIIGRFLFCRRCLVFCHDCGAAVIDRAKFCSACGARLGDIVQDAPQSPSRSWLRQAFSPLRESEPIIVKGRRSHVPSLLAIGALLILFAIWVSSLNRTTTPGAPFKPGFGLSGGIPIHLRRPQFFPISVLSSKFHCHPSNSFSTNQISLAPHIRRSLSTC